MTRVRMLHNIKLPLVYCLPKIRCSKSAQKSAVQVRQVATMLSLKLHSWL